MRGVISAIARDGTYGQIAADDGERYGYWTTQIRNGPVQVGDPVNFELYDGQAVDIFDLAEALAAEGPTPAVHGTDPAASVRSHGAARSAAPSAKSAQFAAAGGRARAAAAHWDAHAAEAGIPTSGYWIDLFTSLSGRISRRQFWLHGVLPLIAIGIVLRVIFYIGLFIMPTLVLYADLAIALILLWPELCISYKRFQDVGYPGWYNLLWLLPVLALQVLTILELFFYRFASLLALLGLVLGVVAGLVALAALIFVYIRPGQQGPNQYGPDPLAAA